MLQVWELLLLATFLNLGCTLESLGELKNPHV